MWSQEHSRQRAKIVATLGPATDDPAIVEALLRTGVNVARLNFSHGTHEEHARRIAWVRDASDRIGGAVAILLDIQGPKIRTGLVEGGAVLLADDAEVTITTEPIVGNARRFSTTYPQLPADVQPGAKLLLSDGRIELRVLAIGPPEVHCRVARGGILTDRQGIVAPGVAISAAALTSKDQADLEFGLGQGIDYVAVSFVRQAADMEEVRSFVSSRDPTVRLVAKIETAEAADHLDEVLAASDAVMVARGDLGVEMGPERVPALQKRIVHAANARGIPVIVATQMLESMIEQTTPTRAEASDVANAVWDGADALMLSGETAIGKHPEAATEAMARIIAAAEETATDLVLSPAPSRTGYRAPLDAVHSISHASRGLAEELQAVAIVGVTRTGRTAELLSTSRPGVPIVALTRDDRVHRQLALWWGIIAMRADVAEDVEALFPQIERLLADEGLARPGDTVLVVGSMPPRVGIHTNFVKVHRVGDTGENRGIVGE